MEDGEVSGTLGADSEHRKSQRRLDERLEITAGQGKSGSTSVVHWFTWPLGNYLDFGGGIPNFDHLQSR